MSEESSESSIMSMRDLIETAFGEESANVVHFKLIQTILYILARQLRVLERRVEIDIGPLVPSSDSNISVTEVKMFARVPRKKRRMTKQLGSDDTGPSGLSAGLRSLLEKTKATAESKGKNSAPRQSKAAQGRKDEVKDTPGIQSKDKEDTSRTKEPSSQVGKPSEAEGRPKKTTKDKVLIESTSDKAAYIKPPSDTTIGGKSVSLRPSIERYAADDQSTGKIITETPLSDTQPAKKLTSDKPGKESTVEDNDKATALQADKPYEKESSIVESSRQKVETTASDKKLADKITIQEHKKSDQKPVDGKTAKSSIKKSADSVSLTDKSGLVSSEESSSAKPTASTTSKEQKSIKENAPLLEKIEEQREKVLRVIHQRADSREEGVSSPSPMASIDSSELQIEKLLVVERISSKESSRRSHSDIQARLPRLSVVSRKEFDELVKTVIQLQEKYAIPTPKFPGNEKLMEELRKGASLTDAMAALQLSARLEAAEIALDHLSSLVTDIARQTPGIVISETLLSTGKEAMTATGGQGADTKVIHSKAIDMEEYNKGPAFQQPSLAATTAASKKTGVRKSAAEAQPGQAVHLGEIDALPSFSVTEQQKPLETDISRQKRDIVSIEELETAMNEMYEELYQKTVNFINKSNTTAEAAMRMAKNMEPKLDKTLDMGDKFQNLELHVAQYAEKINILDTAFSSQMTNYQDLLTQMQHDLETGLENMAEALANQTGDTAAVAELNGHLTVLQIDIDKTSTKQKELDQIQNKILSDLQMLWKQIEILRDTKSDRDEVVDALRDKAGLGDLNGLISLQQFDAVRGDFEKRICNAYDKFNNQEIIWQKAIDDLIRELNEKSDWNQINSLRDDINKNLQNLNSRLQAMSVILGEPRAAGLARRIHRDAACVSCSTPAFMDLEEPGLIPALPEISAKRPRTIGAESNQMPKEDGDHKICYLGMPIPHPPDPRSRVCTRYCGGSHTRTNADGRRQPDASITTAKILNPTEIGTDGKTFISNEMTRKIPCIPCNLPAKKPKKCINDQQESNLEQNVESIIEKVISDHSMTPPDFQYLMMLPVATDDGNASVIPLTPIDESALY